MRWHTAGCAAWVSNLRPAKLGRPPAERFGNATSPSNRTFPPLVKFSREPRHLEEKRGHSARRKRQRTVGKRSAIFLRRRARGSASTPDDRFLAYCNDSKREKPRQAGPNGKNFSACHAASYDVAALWNKSAS